MSGTPNSSDPGDAGTAADEALLAELGSVLQKVDSVPDVLVEQAKQLIAWRDVDAQLEIISHGDSALEGVRGAHVADGVGLLSMQGPDGLALELEVVRAPDGTSRVMGQIAGGDTGSTRTIVAIRIGATVTHSTVDDLGTFMFEDLPAGEMRLLLQVGDEPMLTPWFTV